jgi:hypothetical protein
LGHSPTPSLHCIYFQLPNLHLGSFQHAHTCMHTLTLGDAVDPVTCTILLCLPFYTLFLWHCSAPCLTPAALHTEFPPLTHWVSSYLEYSYPVPLPGQTQPLGSLLSHCTDHCLLCRDSWLCVCVCVLFIIKIMQSLL